MASQSDLILNVTARDNASGPLSRIGSALENLGTQLGGDVGEVFNHLADGLDQIGRSAPNVAGRFTAIGAAAAGLGTALLVLGSKEVQATNQLQAAIEATGNSWDDYEKQVEAAVRQGENFAQSAVDTKNALATLTESTGDPTIALKLIGTAFDLAAAKHEDLSNAANQLGRAVNGNGKILRQYGITIDKTADAMTRAQEVQDGFARRFGGQAAASVDTFAGKIDVVKTKVDDFIGSISGPVGQGLAIVGTGISTVAAIIQVFQGRAALAAAANAELAATNTALAASATEAAAATGAETAAITAEGGAALRTTGGLRSMIVGAGAASAALLVVGEAFNELAADAAAGDAAAQTYFQNFQSGASNLTTLYDQLDRNVGFLDRTLGQINPFHNLERATEVLRDIKVPLSEVNKHLTDSDPEWDKYVTHLRQLSDESGHSADETNLLDLRLNDARDSLGQAKAKYDNLTPSIKATNAAWAATSKTVYAATSAYGTASRDAADAVDKLANKNAAIIPQYVNLIDRNNQVAASTAALTDRWAEYSPIAADAAVNTHKLADAQGRMDVTIQPLIVDLQTIYGIIASHQEDIHHAQDDFAGAAKSIRDLNKEAKPTKQSVHDVYDQVLQAASSAEKASGKTSDYIGSLEALRKKAKPGGELYRELSQLIALLDEAAKTRTATILLKIANSRSGAGHAPSTYYTGPPKAAGGPVQAGVAYLVGERGPELMVPDHSGQIIPNHSLGPNVVHVTYNVYARTSDPQETVRAIQNFERANSDRWRKVPA